MTVDAAPATDALATDEAAAQPSTEKAHEHAWRLVQVDYSDGCCVREFTCRACADVWFA